jgi:hypothetical protein
MASHNITNMISINKGRDMYQIVSGFQHLGQYIVLAVVNTLIQNLLVLVLSSLLSKQRVHTYSQESHSFDIARAIYQ